MSVDTSTAPRPGPRPSTSRQEIVQCTLRMLDREGADALTFRAVARELGMTVGALSRYFKSLADLEDEVAASIMAEMYSLDAGSKLGLREQLLQLGMDLLRINIAHPYLLKIQGPASAAVVGRNARRSLEVLVGTGMEFDRAMSILSLLGALTYGWGAQAGRPEDAERDARTAQALIGQMGEFTPQITRLFAAAGPDFYRQWLEFFIDGVLAAPAAGKKKRR